MLYNNQFGIPADVFVDNEYKKRICVAFGRLFVYVRRTYNVDNDVLRDVDRCGLSICVQIYSSRRSRAKGLTKHHISALR